jgi:hypothetical protein
LAKLTYAALALALGALVSGFFIRTTAVPLFASIALSAVVLILILRGWARRVRQSELGEEELEELEEIDFEPIEAADIAVIEPGEESAELPVLTRSRAEPRERVREPRPRPVRPVRKRPGPVAGGAKVVVLPGRTRYHMPGCRFARGKGAEEIPESTARRRQFQPCSVCLGG